MVADKTKRELESSPEEFSSWVKFYEDRIAHLDEMLASTMDMNRVLMEKLSGDQQILDKYKQEAWERRLNSQRVGKEDQEKWDEYIYEQGEVKSKEDQKKADEAAWSEGRIQCAAVRDAALDTARGDIRGIEVAYSNYTTACIAIDARWDAVRAKREGWGV
jgi:hypothetical protein